MSRSNPETASSPAKKFFEWSAGNGVLSYYDREAKESVPVSYPFPFLILDEVSQVGGGIKVNGKYEGYWSNAVKRLDTQIITVKSKQGIVAQGLYSALRERKGLHYVKGLYIAFYDEEKVLQIGYLKLKGSALGAWFEFTKTVKNIYQGAFVIKGKSDPIAGQNGDYYTPVFAHKAEVSEESDAAAKELDVELQQYLTAYFAFKGNDQTEPQFSGESEKTHAAAAGVETAPVTDDDDIPF